VLKLLFFEMNKYLIPPCFLSFACDRKEEASELAFEQVRISIPISSDQLNNYQESSVYKTENNRMLGFNYLRHTLDFFDLDKQIVERSQSLASDGPNALGQIQLLYWHNEYLFISKNKSFLNVKGEKLE